MRTTSSSKDILIQEDNEQDLKWDKIQRFPMFDRLRKGMLRLVLDRGNVVPYQVVDVTNQGLQDKKLLLESVLKDDNEKFLRKFRERVDRMTLLLGPPGAGKTTLLLALAEKLDRDLRAFGRVTYCGHDLNEFVAKKTCAYISQHDLHHGEMTYILTLSVVTGRR
ncbi:hypothetical protein JHK86_007940 [Glycine max]|nr:hypothetical protein JHK86_007940 [Glycine max]